jgi:peroxiredoxin
MDQSTSDLLGRIEILLHSGKRSEARMLLVEYLTRKPNSERAWWLMSQAVTDLHQQRDCLQRVLILNPDSADARERLLGVEEAIHLEDERLNPPSSPAPFPQTASSAPALQTASSVPSAFEAAPYQPPLGPAGPAGEEPAQDAVPESAAGRRTPGRTGSKAGLIAGILAGLLVFALVGLGMIWMRANPGSASAASLATQNQASTLAVAKILTALPRSSTPTRTALPASPSASPASPTPAPTLTPTLIPLQVQTGPFVGWNAPDFSLENASSTNQVKLSDLLGTPVVIFFFVTWNPYCPAEISSLESIYQAYQSQGLVILAVDVSETVQVVSAFQASHSESFPILLDSDGAVAAKYQVNGIYPTHFFINRSGRITDIKTGLQSIGNLTVLVDALERQYFTPTP